MKPAYHRLPRWNTSGTAAPSAPRAGAYRPTSGLMLTLLCSGLYDSVETIGFFESLFPYLSGPQQTDAYVIIELYRLREQIPYKQVEFAHQDDCLSDEERQIGLLRVLKDYCDASSRAELQRIMDILLQYYSAQYGTASDESPASEYEPPEKAYAWEYDNDAPVPYAEPSENDAHMPYAKQAQEPFADKSPPSEHDTGSSADGGGMDMSSMLSMMNMLGMMQGSGGAAGGGAAGGGAVGGGAAGDGAAGGSGLDPAQLMNMLGMMQGGGSAAGGGAVGGGLDPAQLMNMLGMMQGGSGAASGGAAGGGGLDPAQLMNMLGMMQGGSGAASGGTAGGGGLDPAQLMNMMGMMQGGSGAASGGAAGGGGLDPAQLMNMMGMMQGGSGAAGGGLGNMLQLMQMLNKK